MLSITVAMVTPWNVQCGNAIYAEHLVGELKNFCNIKIIPLDPEICKSSQKKIKKFLCGLAQEANTSDIIHIQHEYSFFGQTLDQSELNFMFFLGLLKKPKVVTFHTVRNDLLPSRKFEAVKKAFGGILFLISKMLPNTITSSAQSFLRSVIISHSLYQSVLNKIDHVIVHSDTSSKILKDGDLRCKNIRAIPIGIPTIHLLDTAIAKAELNVSDKCVLLMVGFVNRYKGHDLAIKALRKLPSDVILFIAGGKHPMDKDADSYEEELLCLIEDYGLADRVHISGFLPDHSMSLYLSAADIILFPYLDVGQAASAAITIAISSGKPIITSRVRSFMDLKRNAPDLIYSFPPGNDEVLTKKINDIIFSYTRREKLLKASVAYRETFSGKNIAKQTASIYQKLLAG